MRVMQSFSAMRDTTNPYLKQLLASISTDDSQARTFSWSAAVRGQFDVLHLHWPEVLLRGSSRSKTWLRRIAFFAVLLRIRFSRRALVRTLHNLAPHEAGSFVERQLLAFCDRCTTLWITLVPSTPVPSGSAPRRTILHGDYRDWFKGVPLPDPVPGRLLYFGLIRAYKGVDDLVRVFGTMSDDELSLRIVGSVKDPVLADEIRSAAERDPRISARLEYVSDADLVDEVGPAEFVVLPYRDMHNSGSALLSLSLSRPILVPANPVTTELSAEVGAGWVQTYTGDLSTEILQAAVLAVRTTPRNPVPDLSARTWDAIGAAHLAAYREALALRRR